MTDSVNNVKLNISDNGSLKAMIADATKLKKELEGAQRAAGGGTSRTPTPVAAARAAAGRDSRLGRSVGSDSGTGSSTRDFAAQAEGLGGLVRIYATFAANIFAVTAAFTALSKAADTANLVKGLDQLGAASGRNLGSVAKQLVAATDGAISLREALTATSQASSGGLSNANILKLGTIAKQASQALGIDMVNAVSRLSRGITKLEPELLDEIGIFVRVDKASADYARSIGKSVSALTDFEKRQAFANAVLEQGAAKFGAIDLDVNPYSKIQASLENLAFSGLNLINKVLGPLLDLLASNPVALGAAAAGFANVLLRQAIPAIGQYKERLAAAAENQRQLVIETNKLRKDQKFAFDSEEGVAIADRAMLAERAAKATQIEVENLKQSKSIREKAVGNKLIDVTTAGEKELLGLKNLQLSVEKELSKAQLSGSTGIINRRQVELKIIQDSVKAVEDRIRAEKDQDRVDQNVSKNRVRDFFSQEESYNRLADRAAARSQRFNILNDVAAQQPARGVIDSYKELNRQIKLAKIGQDAAGNAFDNNQKKMGGFNAALTKTVGTAQILGSALGTLVSSLSQIAFVVTAVITAVTVVASFFKKAQKETDKYEESLASVESGVKTVDKTMEAIRKKPVVEFLSIESMQAAATAMNDLSDSVKSASQSFDKLRNARGFIESIGNALADVIGKGDADKLATALSDAIVASIDAARTGPAKEKAKAVFRDILNVDPTNAKAMERALRSLTEGEISVKAKAIAAALSEVSREANNSASNLTSLKSGILETSKLVNDLNNKLKPSDTSGKIGTALIGESGKIDIALKSNIEGLAALKEAVGNVNFLSVLPPELATKLAQSSNQINSLSDAVSKTSAELEKAAAAYEKAKQSNSDITSTRARNAGSGSKNAINEINKSNAALAEAEAAYKSAQASNQRTQANLSKLISEFAGMGDKVFGEGVKRLGVSLAASIQEGGITAAKGILSILKQAGGATAAEETSLKLQEIGIQKNLIQAQFQSFVAIQELTLTIERATAEGKLARLEDAKKSGEDVDNQIYELEKQIKVLDAKQGLFKTGTAKSFTESKDPIIQEARKSAADFVSALFGRDAQLAKLNGQSSAVKVQGKVSESFEGIDFAKKNLENQEKSVALQKEVLSQRSNILGTYDAESDKQSSIIADAETELNYQKQFLEIARKIVAAQIVINESGGNKDRQDRARVALSNAQAENTALLAERETKLTTNALAGLDRRYKGERQIADLIAANTQTRRAAEDAITDAQLNNSSRNIDNLLQSGRITEANAARAKADIDVSREKLASEIKLVSLYKTRNDAENEYYNKLAQAETISDPTEQARQIQLITAAQSEALSVIDSQISGEVKVSAVRLQGVEAIKAQAVAQAELNEKLAEQESVMQLISTVTEGLAESFGKVGTAVGIAAKAIVESSQKQEAINRKLEKDRAAYAKDAPKLAKIESKAVFESRDAQLESFQVIASAAKGLFGERTKAAKAFAAAEKTISIARTALQIKETATQLGLSATKASAFATEAIAAAFAAPFPVGFVAGAAMIAIMASLLGKKSVTVPGGFSAEEQQKVQGTGQQYDSSGTLVNRSGGALGDPTAKANSLNNSIEKLEEHAFENLEYSNAMLDNLKGIKRNTEGLSALLLQSGLNTRGINPDGTTQFGKSIDKSIIGQSVVDANNLLFGKGTGITNTMNKLAVSVFGGKKTTELQDVGVAFNGSINSLIDQLVMGGEDLNALYQNIKVTVDGGWFRGDKTSFETELFELEQLQAEAFGNIFSGIGNSVRSAADVLGKESKLVEDSIAGFNVAFKTSFKDLSPEEITQALEAEFSVAFNQLAERVLPEFQKFRKPGEEFGDTIVRIARDVQVSSLALEAAGLNLGNISAYAEAGESFAETNVRITEALIDSIGGLDALVEKTDFYAQNFLTEAERLAPVQARVTAEMGRLGLASIDTREEFANVVKGLDLASESGRETYSALLNVAPAFAEITEELEDSKSKLSDLKSTFKQLTDTYNSLTMSTEEYLATKRAEYKTVEEQTQFDSNTALENTIKALQTEQQQKTQLTNLEIDLMSAQGNATQALSAKRELELSKLDPVNRALQALIYSREDEIATVKKNTDQLKTLSNLDIDIMRARGETAAATNKIREAELELLSPINRDLQRYIYLKEDELKTLNELNGIKSAYNEQDVTLLKTLGLDTDALNLARSRELDSLDPANRALKLATYAREDEISKMQEFMNLKDELTSVEAASLREQGREVEALALERSVELSRLDKSNRAVKLLIYARQDEITAMQKMKQVADELRSGYASAQDALKSAVEGVSNAKQNLSEKLFAAQDRLEELKKQKQEETNNLLQESVDKLRDFAKSLRDFIDELATGDLNPASGATKQALLRNEFETLKLKAAGGDQDAIDKIQGVASKYLEAAKSQSSTNLDFASIYGYVINSLDILSESADALANKKAKGLQTPQDKMVELQKEINAAQKEVNTLMSAANSIGAATKQVTEDILAEYRTALAEQRTAEQDVEIYKTAITSLGIDIANKTTADSVALLVAQYTEANGSFVSSQAAIESAVELGTGDVASKIAGLSTYFTSLGLTIAEGSGAIVSAIAGLSGIAASDSKKKIITPAVRVGTKPSSTPAFASGGEHAGGIRLVGERGPELELTGPSKILNNKQTEKLLDNQELIAEIKAMRKELELMRYVAEKTETHTKRTRDTLVRVTRDGDSLVTSTT